MKVKYISFVGKLIEFDMLSIFYHGGKRYVYTWKVKFSGINLGLVSETENEKLNGRVFLLSKLHKPNEEQEIEAQLKLDEDQLECYDPKYRKSFGNFRANLCEKVFGIDFKHLVLELINSKLLSHKYDEDTKEIHYNKIDEEKLGLPIYGNGAFFSKHKNQGFVSCQLCDITRFNTSLNNETKIVLNSDHEYEEKENGEEKIISIDPRLKEMINGYSNEQLEFDFGD